MLYLTALKWKQLKFTKFSGKVITTSNFNNNII